MSMTGKIERMMKQSVSFALFCNYLPSRYPNDVTLNVSLVYQSNTSTYIQMDKQINKDESISKTHTF